MARKSKIDKKIAELKRLEKQRKERERREKISRTKKKNISIREIPQQIGRRAQANVIIVGGTRSDVGKKRKPKSFAEKKNREIQSTGIQDYAQLRGQRKVAQDKLGYDTQTKDPLALSRGGGRYLRDATDTEAGRRDSYDVRGNRYSTGRTGSEEVVRRENQNFAARLSALEASQRRDIRLGEATSRARKKGGGFLMDRFLNDNLFSDTDSSSISTRSSLSDSTSFFSQSTTPSDRRRSRARVAEARRPSTAPEPAPAPAQPPAETGRSGTRRFTDPAFQRAIRGTELKKPVQEQQRLIFPKLPDPSPAREGAPQPPPLVFDESQEERRQEALKEFQQVPTAPPRQVQVDTSGNEIDRELRRAIDEDTDEEIDDEGFDTAEEDPNIEADRLVRRASPQIQPLQPQRPPPLEVGESPSLPTFESEFGELGRRARRIAEERKKPLSERRMTATQRKPELPKRTRRTQIEQLTDDLIASARDPNRRQGLQVQVVEVPKETSEEQARVKKEIEDKKKAREKERERQIEDRILAQNLSRDIVSRASRRDTQRRGVAREALEDIMSGAERRGLARRTARDIVSGALRREEIDRRREQEAKANQRPVVEGEGRPQKPKRKKGRPRTPRRELIDRKKELMEELTNFNLHGRGDLRGIGTTPQRLNIIIQLARGRLNQQGLPELFPEVEQKIREIHNLTKQIG